MEKSTTEAGKVSFVQRILANLNLTSDQQVTSFVLKVTRRLEKEIKTAKNNISVLESQLESAREAYEEELDDLESALNDTYNNVDINQIKTHEQQNNHVDSYLNAIAAASAKIERRKESFNNDVERFERRIAEYEKTIASLEKQLDVFQN